MIPHTVRKYHPIIFLRHTCFCTIKTRYQNIKDMYLGFEYAFSIICSRYPNVSSNAFTIYENRRYCIYKKIDDI